MTDSCRPKPARVPDASLSSFAQPATTRCGSARAGGLPVCLREAAPSSLREAFFMRAAWEKTHEAWAEFLSRYPWDVFATLTYAGSVWCDEKIVKNVEEWLYRWQLATAIERCLCKEQVHERKDAYGRVTGYRRKLSGTWYNAHRKKRARPVYVIGIEPHKSGHLHAHVLIRWSDKLPDLSRQLGWKLWFESRTNGGLGHGFAKIEGPKSQGDVASYVSKYVVKGGDLYLSPSFNAARLVAA